MALRRIISKKNLFRNNPRGSSFGNVRGLQTLSLPDIPYGYGALEPVISREIMELHHQKHHNTYVTNFNKALKQLDEAMNNGDSPTIVELQSAIKFNGGGMVTLVYIFLFFFIFFSSEFVFLIISSVKVT